MNEVYRLRLLEVANTLMVALASGRRPAMETAMDDACTTLRELVQQAEQQALPGTIPLLRITRQEDDVWESS